ncbi:DinB family protein [Glycomyces salinus]|uniref:DinB family protein n=1 Tax=Glycomyces salinus TaxID=980294 RepID=UPI0018ED9E50|nr:DinB family protein [Glycomyces salinus]
MKREDPHLTGGERATLEGFLDFHRETLRLKCAGLSADQLRLASVPPSNMSLLGLVRHLTDVENWWFRELLLGDTDFDQYHRDEEPDRAFEAVSDADPAAVLELHRTAITACKEAAASRNLDDTFEHPQGGPSTLRWVYVHMIEEYSRHNGHADLIRERIDGATGE